MQECIVYPIKNTAKSNKLYRMSRMALRGAKATTMAVETPSRRKLAGDFAISAAMASEARPATVRKLPLRFFWTLSQSLAWEMPHR